MVHSLRHLWPFGYKRVPILEDDTMMQKLAAKLLRPLHVKVDVTIEAAGATEVGARPSARRARCGGCGRKGKRLHDTQGKAREWRHLGMWGRRSF